MQEAKSVVSQALQNVVMLADLISLTLEIDSDESSSFSQSGESISKQFKLTKLFVVILYTIYVHTQVLRLSYFLKVT